MVGFFKIVLFTFYFKIFWLCHMECGILVSRLGTEPQTLHGKCGVLATRPPGKSRQPVYNLCVSTADWLCPWMLRTPGDVSTVPHLHLQRCASKCPLHSTPLPICPLHPVPHQHCPSRHHVTLLPLAYHHTSSRLPSYPSSPCILFCCHLPSLNSRSL